jgi:hypothetical protein
VATAGPRGFVSAAVPAVHLVATLTPEHLGGHTSIGLAFDIDDPGRRVPRPITRVDLRYANDFGIALSDLGTETCTQALIEAHGAAACPADSMMGRGYALGEIPFGPEIIHERATLMIFRAEDENGRIALLFDAEGLSPVLANIVFPGVLLPARPPYGGDIHIVVPVVPSLPEAPDVAVIKLSATIGPAAGLVYSERRGDGVVSYAPTGILVPERCPRGGFPFAANIAFQAGASASAHAKVRCPQRVKASQLDKACGCRVHGLAAKMRRVAVKRSLR